MIYLRGFLNLRITTLASFEDFGENDLIAITWTVGDQPEICQIVRFERGFIVTKELKTGNRVVIRPHSPYKIEKIAVK